MAICWPNKPLFDRINHSWYWNPTCFQVENWMINLDDDRVHISTPSLQIFFKCILWKYTKWVWHIFYDFEWYGWLFLVLGRHIIKLFKQSFKMTIIATCILFPCLFNLLKDSNIYNCCKRKWKISIIVLLKLNIQNSYLSFTRVWKIINLKY